MIRAKRKDHLSEFPVRTNWVTVLLIALLFLIGLGITWQLRLSGVVLYGLLWVGSYLVLYVGTCRNCVYYGKRCPVPLEGSCVQYVVRRGNGKFGFSGLVWATLAYVMRIGLPFYIIAKQGMILAGILYGGTLALFWIVHLFVTGCPNCINSDCPLNPDKGGLHG